MATIDQLSIELTADVSKAESAINKLSARLNALNTQLSGINTQGLSQIGIAIQGIANGMNAMKGMGEKKFETLANSINKLTLVDYAGVAKTASALNQLNIAFSSVASNNGSASSVAAMADAIRKFGYSTVPQAIANMPLLAKALKEMMQTLTTAPQVSQNLIQMTQALSNLANASRGYSQTAPDITTYWYGFSNLSNKVTNGFKSVRRSLASLKPEFKSVASYIGRFYASCFLIIRAVKALGRTISSSMDYVETYNYFNVALSKIQASYIKQGGEDAEAYAQAFYEKLKSLNEKMTGYTLGNNGELIDIGNVGLGLDIERLMNYQAQIMAVTNSVGMLEDASINTSKALSMLASDLSSLTNTDLSTVMQNLQSGLIGQSRALYKFGIDITSASLAEEALAQGVTKSVSAMSQSEKMQLRILRILRDSKVAWGDQANTINSVANQYRILGQQAGNLARILGNLFLPIIKNILPWVNGLVIALQRLLSALGMNIYGGNWLKDLMDGISDGYSPDGLEDMTDDLDDAADAGKKLKNSLMGIDELNVLNQDSGSGSGGGGSSIDLSNQIADALAEYEKAWNLAFARSENLANKYADIITRALKPVYDMLDNIFDGKYYQAGSGLGIAIGDALRNIDWDYVYASVSNFGKNLASFLNGLISPDLFSAVAKTIASALNTKLHFINTFGEEFDWTDFGLSVGSGINTFFQTYDFALLASAISNIALGLLDAFLTAVETVDWNLVGLKIGEFLANLKWGQILGKTLKAIGEVLVGITSAWGSAFSEAPIEMTAIAMAGLLSVLINIVPKIATFVLNFGKLKTTLKECNTSIGAFAKGFGSIAGNVVGIVTMVTSLVTMNSCIKDIALGTEDLGKKIATLVVSVGTLFTASALVFGVPAGLIIAGVTAAISAISALDAAYTEMYAKNKAQNIADILTPSDGMSFEEYCQSYADSINLIADGFGNVANGVAIFEESTFAVESTYTEIDSIKQAVLDGKVELEEAIPQVEELMGGLSDSLKEQFGTTYDLIYESLSGSVRASLEANGLYVPDLINLMNGLESEYDQAVDSIQQEMADLKESYDQGGETFDSYWEKMLNLISQLNTITGETDVFTESMDNLGSTIDGIDFEGILGDDGSIDTDKLEQKIGVVTNAYQESVTALDDWYAANEKYFNQQIAIAEWTGDEETAKQLENYLGIYKDTVDKKKEELGTVLDGFSTDLQNYLVEKIPDVVSSASDEYNSKGLLDKYWGNVFNGQNEYSIYKDYLIDYRNSVITPVTDKLSEMFEEIGATVEPIAKDTATDIISSINTYQELDYDSNQIEEAVVDFVEDSLESAQKKIENDEKMKDLLESVFNIPEDGFSKEDVMGAASKIGEFVTGGFAQGITNTVKSANEKVSDFGNSVVTTLQDLLKIHSPSEVTDEMGGYFVDGFAQGIDSEFEDSFKPSFSKMMGEWLTEVAEIFGIENWTFDGISEGLVGSFTVALEAIKTLWNGFADSLNEKLKLNIPASEYTGGTAQVVSLGKIPKFSMGGFPDGENGLFYANSSEIVGRFSNGQTAVATDYQIEAGISRGVREAVHDELSPYLTQIANNTRETANKDFNVAIGDREIARANKRGNRSLGRTIITQA